MARVFENIWISPDRGDSKPFVQVNWHNEFGQSQTREIADFLDAANHTKIRQLCALLKAMAEAEDF